MDKETYTIRETAKILNIGISKTYEIANQNIIPNIKIGRRIIIPRTGLTKWLEKSWVGDKQ
jgi:excisionase family DNA binding protein